MDSNSLLKIVTRLFGKKAGRYAKAILPALGGLVAVVVQWAATGVFDRAELNTAVVAVGAAVLTALTPNAKTSTQRRPGR